MGATRTHLPWTLSRPRRRPRGRALRAGLCLAFACAGLPAVAAGSLSWLRPRSPVEAVTKDEGRFYRFVARYTVKATGEALDFDVVVPCRRVLTTYKWGETTVDMAAQSDAAPYPFAFPKATRDGHALVLGVPNACGEFRGPNRTLRTDVPADLMPKVTWFEDADRLDFGLMYAHPAAYDSPLAKITFHGAAFSPATAADHAAWLERLKRDFRPTGSIVFPYGFGYGHFHIGGNWPLMRRPDGWIWVAQSCFGLKRLRITDETVRARVREAWPQDRPRYWDPRAVLGDKDYRRLQSAMRSRVEGSRAYPIPAFEGQPLDAWSVPDGRNTIPPVGGGRVFPVGSSHPTPVFPMMRDDTFDPWFTQNTDDTRQSYRDYETRGGDLLGFLGCSNSSGAHPSQIARMRANGPFFREERERLDGVVLPPFGSGGVANTVFERDEYYWAPVQIFISGE